MEHLAPLRWRDWLGVCATEQDAPSTGERAVRQKVSGNHSFKEGIRCFRPFPPLLFPKSLSWNNSCAEEK